VRSYAGAGIAYPDRVTDVAPSTSEQPWPVAVVAQKIKGYIERHEAYADLVAG
jgi:hypothetical protein